MMAPSINFPKESSSTIAASSIQGIGAQKLARPWLMDAESFRARNLGQIFLIVGGLHRP